MSTTKHTKTFLSRIRSGTGCTPGTRVPLSQCSGQVTVAPVCVALHDRLRVLYRSWKYFIICQCMILKSRNNMAMVLVIDYENTPSLNCKIKGKYQYGTNVTYWTMLLTWFLEQNLFDIGVIEVFMPVVPLAPSEAQVATCHAQISLGPVPRVGTHWPPFTLHQHLHRREHS